jgi:hypothetical protein
MDELALRWTARTVPLPARAVLARGEAARALGRALLGWADGRLAEVAACAGGEVLVVLGEEAALPWVDGATYLGHDSAAPGLLVPTNRIPGVPLDLFAEALRPKLPAGGGPWAVVPRPGGAGLTTVATAAAGPIGRAQLEAWLAGP